MKNRVATTVLPLALVCALAGCSAPHQKAIREADYSAPIRVACVGDSITYGYGLKDREHESYPARLASMLGPKWSVRNFGVNGATLLKNGTRPYLTQPALREELAFEPDVVIVQLGTNDTKPENWGAHKNEFVPDYLELIRRFSERKTRPRIYLCRPVPLFRDRGKSFDPNKMLVEILPVINRVAHQERLPLIDLYGAFEKEPERFPDGVHPDAAGADLIARHIYAALLAKATDHK